MPNPMISIIIPHYNSPSALFKKCLQSIQRSSYSNFECIIVDDGSSVSPWTFIKEVCHEDERFKFFSIDHAGVSEARNKGLDLAAGELITFVDADDEIHENFLHDAVQMYMKEHSDLLLGKIVNCYDGNPIAHLENETPSHIVIDKDEIYFLRRHLIAGRKLTNTIEYPNIRPYHLGGKVYKRDIISGLRFNTDLNVAEDACFIICTSNRIQTISISNEYWYKYNIDVNASATNSANNSLQLLNRIRRMKNVELQALSCNVNPEDAATCVYVECTTNIVANAVKIGLRNTISVVLQARKEGIFDNHALINVSHYQYERSDQFTFKPYARGNFIIYALVMWGASVYRVIRAKWRKFAGRNHV